MAEQFLDFPQILSHLVEEDRGRGVAQSMRGDLPYPEGSTGVSSLIPKVCTTTPMRTSWEFPGDAASLMGSDAFYFPNTFGGSSTSPMYEGPICMR